MSRQSDIIDRMAEKMRDEAETGLPDRIFRHINFRALALSAYLAIRTDLKEIDDGDQSVAP